MGRYIGRDEPQVEAHWPSPSHGDIYRHFKGGLYVIECIGTTERTMRPAVVYRRFDGPVDRIWVRPSDNFFETVKPAWWKRAWSWFKTGKDLPGQPRFAKVTHIIETV